FSKAASFMAKACPRGARKGLYLWLELVTTDAKANYVPVDKGVLRSSGFVILDEDESVIRGTIGFGGPAGNGNMGETNAEDVNYAIIQHENLDYHHEVGEAKFLERPLFAGMSQGLDVIADSVRREMESV
ncbi:MAG: hypothetical protein ACREB3_15865, partial [Burkholderiales bacterium]